VTSVGATMVKLGRLLTSQRLRTTLTRVGAVAIVTILSISAATLVWRSIELVQSNGTLRRSIADRRAALPLRLSGRFLEDTSHYTTIRESMPKGDPRIVVHIVVGGDEGDIRGSVIPWIAETAGSGDVRLRISTTNADRADTLVAELDRYNGSWIVDRIRDTFQFSKLTGIRHVPVAVAMNRDCLVVAIVTGNPDPSVTRNVLSSALGDRPTFVSLAGSAPLVRLGLTK
jgi:hypothetical protein